MAKADPKLVVAAIGLAVAIAAPFAQNFEGFVSKPKPDPAAIPTYCFGETENAEDRIYTKSECAALLRARMAKDYAPFLVDCMPALVEPKNRNAFAAFLDTSYNTGPGPVCRRVAVQFNTGHVKAACNSLIGWYTTARNRRTGIRTELPGLVRRRKAEAALCLKGLP